jgi:hypothetical protein
MQSRQTTPLPSAEAADATILRPDPRWFLVRGIGAGLVVPLLLRAIGAGKFALLFPVGVAALWVLFRNSYIRLDSHGFSYHSAVRRVAQSWLDIERFSIVEQRMYVFIRVSRYVGWNYSPAYRNYKRLVIPRTITRWAGMTDAMFKPVGFNVPELTSVMNQHLERARAAEMEKRVRSA